MKNVFMVIVVCVSFVISCMAGHCQDYDSSDSSIERDESQMDRSLESEISSDQSQGQAEMDSANEEMNAGLEIR
jgi:hypothetical protein